MEAVAHHRRSELTGGLLECLWKRTTRGRHQVALSITLANTHILCTDNSVPPLGKVCVCCRMYLSPRL